MVIKSFQKIIILIFVFFSLSFIVSAFFDGESTLMPIVYFYGLGGNSSGSTSSCNNTIYRPNSINTITGTPSASSDIIDIKYHDLHSYNITEVSGGIEAHINFTSVIDFEEVAFRELYTGSTSHKISIDLWNYITSSWTSFDEIHEATYYEEKFFNILNSSKYISSGTVKMRIYHAPTGTGSHNIKIENIILEDDPNCGGSGTGTGITDGDKGDINVTGSGTVWTADMTLIDGKTGVAPEEYDKVLFLDTTDNTLHKANVAQMGYRIQTGGMTLTRRDTLNFASPLYAYDDPATQKTIITTSSPSAAGFNGDFQWNYGGALTGDAYLSTDGNFIYIGETLYHGYTTDTYFSGEGWQQMSGVARPWKEAKYSLEPKEGVSSFTAFDNGGFDMPEVAYGFGNIVGLPYYQMVVGAGQEIPFTFELPEDYQDGTPFFFHIHFSLMPYLEGTQSTGTIYFDVSYVVANQQKDCQSFETFATYSNVIVSCEAISNLPYDFPHYVTELDDARDVYPGDYSYLGPNAIIKGMIRLNGNTDFDNRVIPLYIDIDYISNKLGTYAKRNIK